MRHHSNVEVLRAIYADLGAIASYCDEDVVLHAAERGLPGQTPAHRGVTAVQAKERELMRLTGGTLIMEVMDITANDHFGAVTGLLRARRGDHAIAMPFCGLWRFRNGRVIEHWENAYDVAALGAFLAGSIEAAGCWLTTAAADR